jgi:hypothetical protein
VLRLIDHAGTSALWFWERGIIPCHPVNSEYITYHRTLGALSNWVVAVPIALSTDVVGIGGPFFPISLLQEIRR